MNTATSNKLLLGCFCLSIVTMISTLYMVNTSTRHDPNSQTQVMESISHLQAEVNRMHEEVSTIRRDVKYFTVPVLDELQVSSSNLSVIVNLLTNDVTSSKRDLAYIIDQVGGMALLRDKRYRLDVRNLPQNLSERILGIEILLDKICATLGPMNEGIGYINGAIIGGDFSQSIYRSTGMKYKLDAIYNALQR